MAVVASFTARAELPRLVPLFELEDRGADRFPFIMTEPLSEQGWQAGRRGPGDTTPRAVGLLER